MEKLRVDYDAIAQATTSETMRRRARGKTLRSSSDLRFYRATGTAPVTGGAIS
jgi:hypothetical protein